MNSLFVALLLAFATVSSALIFKLPVNSEKCLKEEIHKDVLVKGEYAVTALAGVTVNLLVRFISISTV